MMNINEDGQYEFDPWSISKMSIGQKNKTKTVSLEDVLKDDLTIFATKDGDRYDQRDERR